MAEERRGNRHYTCDVNITMSLAKGYDSPYTMWREINKTGYTRSKEQQKRHRHSTLHSTITYLRTGLHAVLPVQSCHGLNSRTSSRGQDCDYNYL